ncbi:MAG: class I SAM-dependent methyltransferase [Actinomycetota bacterium]|nr:class I SAM-dependent methyltransferase [Actinomycetota bacterium]
MPGRLYRQDPLTPEEREAYERDLISFCDRELGLLGDVEGLAVLYAGGSSPLWLESLSQRIGENGILTAFDADPERVEEGRKLLREAGLAAPVRLVAGDAFRPPFPPGTFDLAYSAGFFHELDVRERPAGDALAALASTVRPGGRVATSDFVDSVPAVQLEDEELQRELAREASGAEYYGIGSPERLVTLHGALLTRVRWQVLPPHHIRHLDKIVLAEEEPEELQGLPAKTRRKLRERREAFWERIGREGYTRPATVYVEGEVVTSRAQSLPGRRS